MFLHQSFKPLSIKYLQITTILFYSKSNIYKLDLQTSFTLMDND